MNKIIISGRLGSDPELKAAASGVEFCNFTVAVNRRVKKGEEQKTDWINCTAFNKTAAFIQQYFHKGDGIIVQGRMESSTSETGGEKRTWWAVTVEEVEFPQSSKRDVAQVQSVDAAQNSIIETDEDLPF